MSARVLVVDDDAALSEMIGIVLESEGFEAVFSADGTTAMEAFRQAQPDLVLLDLMLPGIDGIEVCKRIRAESGVPIVMLTAKSDTADVVLGLEAGEIGRASCRARVRSGEGHDAVQAKKPKRRRAGAAATEPAAPPA